MKQKHHKLCAIIVGALSGIVIMLGIVRNLDRAKSYEAYSKECYADSTAERVYVVWAEDTVWIDGMEQANTWVRIGRVRHHEKGLNREQYLKDKRKLLYSYVKYNHRQPTDSGYLQWRKGK